MNFRRPRVFLGLLCLRTLAPAQAPAIPEAETLQPPGAARLAAICSAAQHDGWESQRAALRAAAVHAYEDDKLAAAGAWLNAYRWATLFAEPDRAFIPQWIAAINDARVGHPNMPRTYTPRGQPLGAALAPEVQAWLVGSAGFSQEFFDLLAPVDYVPEVFAILNELYRRDPARCKTYANLALALALVYDVPPPPIWPHAQVPAAALPRKLPAPADAFRWWTEQDRRGRLFLRLGRLGPEDLKFVVDAAAPFSELEWAQTLPGLALNELPRAYTMIRYRTDRVKANLPDWPGPTYRLPEILATGGICADQAYFATEVGKARGVPTLLIYGAGNDARHAWFGYLDANRKWHLDAGRYAEQRFVTGYARDPQTWREFTDHELQFLSEGFRRLPSYRQSRVHAAFAAEFLRGGDAAAAGRAARKAVNYERRNQDGWELLIAAARKEGRDARTIESVMREAALAFQRYPDLEADYANRVAESLRERGQTSEADTEIRRIALKNQAQRGDLSILEARNIVWRAIETQQLPGQLAAYHRVLDLYGRGAGVAFFDGIVTPFVEHLAEVQQPREAQRALERARRTLRVEPNSQLEREFTELAKAIGG